MVHVLFYRQGKLNRNISRGLSYKLHLSIIIRRIFELPRDCYFCLKTCLPERAGKIPTKHLPEKQTIVGIANLNRASIATNSQKTSIKRLQ